MMCKGFLASPFFNINQDEISEERLIAYNCFDVQTAITHKPFGLLQ